MSASAALGGVHDACHNVDAQRRPGGESTHGARGLAFAAAPSRFVRYAWKKGRGHDEQD